MSSPPPATSIAARLRLDAKRLLRHLYAASGVWAIVPSTPELTYLPKQPTQSRERPPWGILAGLIVDEAGAGLVGADVVLIEVDRTVQANREGRFAVDSIPPIRLSLMARAIGYRPAFATIQISPVDTTFVLFRMRAIVHQLPELDTTVPTNETYLPDFARRRASGVGYFVDQEAFAAAHPLSVSQFLRRYSVLQIVDSAGVPQAISRRAPKVASTGAIMVSVPCVMRVAVDGQLLPWGTSVDFVPANAVAALEIFTGPSTVPIEFAGQTKDIGCGLVSLWTRRR